VLGLGLAALLLPGCGSKHAKQATAPVIETAAVPAPAVPAATQVSPTITLYGTLSPEEVERCYSSTQVSNVGLPRPVQSQAPASVVYDNSVAPADARWDVRLGRTWSHIVIHHSASETGSADSFHKYHLSKGWDGLGYHFVIGNGTGSGNGEVEVGYRWKQQQRGAHAGNLEYNEHGIGICLVGDFESGYPTQKQIASLRSLVRFLQSKCGIADAAVIGHDDVPGKKTRCPGAHFPMDAFRRSLSGLSVSAPAAVSTRAVTTANRSGAGFP
jgi:N-acetyl-anhydromuramyl-L-alanine amidase AmpD